MIPAGGTPAKDSPGLAWAMLGLPSPVSPRLVADYLRAKQLADEMGIHDAVTELARISPYSYPSWVDHLVMIPDGEREAQVRALLASRGGSSS